jgi:hypothetical protein
MMKGIGLDGDLIENDDPINLQFSQNGFESMQFMVNIGSTLLFVVGYLALWLFFLFLSRIYSFWPKLLRLKTILEKALIWNQSINLLISQFTPLMLSSLINLLNMNFKGESVSRMSAYWSIVIILAIIGSVIAIIIRLVSLSRNMNDESVKEFN